MCTRVASPKGEALFCHPQGGFWPDVYFLHWCSYLFEMMSDGISEQSSRKMRCRKWISLVVRWCLYTPATEPVLQSIHYARSGISCSGAALRRHHKTLCNQAMEPKGDFFWKIIRPKSSIWVPRESLCLGMRVLGFGQITWRIVQTKKMRGNLENKNYGNRDWEIATLWEVGVWVHIDSGRKLAQVLKPNTNAQGLPLLSHLLHTAYQNSWRFDLYRLWPLRNEVVIKRNSLARLAAVRCVCVVSIDNPWLSDFGFH